MNVQRHTSVEVVSPDGSLFVLRCSSERVPDDVMKTIEDKVKGKLAELVKKHKPGAQV